MDEQTFANGGDAAGQRAYGCTAAAIVATMKDDGRSVLGLPRNVHKLSFWTRINVPNYDPLGLKPEPYLAEYNKHKRNERQPVKTGYPVSNATFTEEQVKQFVSA